MVHVLLCSSIYSLNQPRSHSLGALTKSPPGVSHSLRGALAQETGHDPERIQLKKPRAKEVIVKVNDPIAYHVQQEVDCL